MLWLRKRRVRIKSHMLVGHPYVECSLLMRVSRIPHIGIYVQPEISCMSAPFHAMSRVGVPAITDDAERRSFQARILLILSFP